MLCNVVLKKTKVAYVFVHVLECVIELTKC